MGGGGWGVPSLPSMQVKGTLSREKLVWLKVKGVMSLNDEMPRCFFDTLFCDNVHLNTTATSTHRFTNILHSYSLIKIRY
jgi:hypothetical protein